jgi:cob(I)alamin adenosyltransferase
MENLPRITAVTGNGKGKTTSGMGRALLAAASGERVMVVQFLKGTGYTGELEAAAHWQGNFKICQFGAGCHRSLEIAEGTEVCKRCGDCFRENRKPENDFAGKAFACARAAAVSGEWDLLVLDEISHSVNRGLLKLSEVLAWIESVRSRVRLVLTGRNMPPELLALADEATECALVKHPITQGIWGRRGVEY